MIANTPAGDADACPHCGNFPPLELLGRFCPHCELQGALELTETHPSSSSADASQPRSFGEYELIEEIGRGGMGIVWKARQTSLDRWVALKMILAGRFASPAEIRRFRAEAEATAALRHPNLISIHEYFEIEGQPCFSMDLLSGRTLADLVRGGAGPVHRDAARYLERVARAIQHAHDHQVLHRDLKPSNVLLDDNDEPRVTDFGLAKRFDRDLQLTETGQTLGSPSYSAPEQLSGDFGQVGNAADIYSLGAILYHLLIGRPPFYAARAVDTIQQVLHNDPVPPRTLDPSIPPDLETVCLKCLNKEPGRRYASAADFADELARFLQNEPVRARPVGAAEKLLRWCKRKPLLAGATALCAVLLAIVSIGGPLLAVRAEHARKLAAQGLYVTHVQLASEALEDKNLALARSTIAGITASSLERDFRGWEWRHIWEQCQARDSIVLGRHASGVAAVAMAPDGNSAISLGADGRVNVWNLRALQLSDSWSTSEPPGAGRDGFLAGALQLSPDGRMLVVGLNNGSVQLRASDSGRILDQTDLGSPSACRGLAFSQDGQWIAAINRAGDASLWSATNHQFVLRSRWKAANSLAFGLAFSPDARALVASSYEHPVSVWNVSNPHRPQLDRLLDHTQWRAKFSPDGRWLVAVGASGHDLRRWALPDWKPQPSWTGRSANVIELAFSADSRYVAAGYGGGEITLWDNTGSEPPKALLGHVDYITGLAFSSSGESLISSSRDGTLRLWNLTAPDRSRIRGPGFAALAVGFSRDSSYLASIEFVAARGRSNPVASEHALTLWKLATNQWREVAHRSIGGSTFSSFPEFSPDGSLVSADDWRTEFQVFAVPTLESRLRCGAGAFNPIFADGSLIHAAGPEIIRRFGVSPDAAKLVLGRLSSDIRKMAASPDRRTVACCLTEDDGCAIELWNATQGKRIGALSAHTASVYGLCFSPDGRWLVSSGADGRVIVWNLANRSLYQSLHGHSGVVVGTAFAADGARLATGGEDGVVRLWDTETWLQTAAFPAGASLNSITFSPDGAWLAAAAQDGTVRLWHAPAWAEIRNAEDSSSDPH